MGSLFVNYFTTRGFPTIISDTRKEKARVVTLSAGAELAPTNSGAVEDVDLALICVPIEKTGEIILELAHKMRRDAVLAEISALKGPTLGALREAALAGIRPLSIHPLFGPSSRTLEGKSIAVIPVVDGEREARLAKRLFEEADIIVSEQEEHDRAMAVVLSLTYFMNLTFARVLSGEDILSMKRLSGTTFAVQLAIVEAIVGEDPHLVASLLKENRYTKLYIDRYIDEAGKLKGLIGGSLEGFIELQDLLKSSLDNDPDFSRADERRYMAFEALRAL